LPGYDPELINPNVVYAKLREQSKKERERIVPWETDSGLKDDFVLRVDSTYFEENEKMGNQLCLHLSGTDLDDLEGDVIDNQYACGPGWESPDGGSAVHFKGKEKFNRNTKIGLLIDRMAEVLSPEQLAKMGEPTQADTWNNLVIHFVAEFKEYQAFKDRDGNEHAAGKTRNVLPTEVWGSEESYSKSAKTVDSKPAVADNKSAAPSKAEQAKQALAARKAAAEKKEAPSDNLLERRLIGLAQSHDQATFAEKALDIEEVAANDDLIQAVMDESETGFWATHQK